MAGSKKKRSKAYVSPMNPNKAVQLFKKLFASGDFEAALKQAQAFLTVAPNNSLVLSDAATTCIFLNRWQDAIQYASKAISITPKLLVALDALSHAYGVLGQYEQAKVFGLQALSLRDQQYHRVPASFTPRIDADSAQINVISFSLFGGNSKYCECAVLNCIEQKTLYPDWQCYFYVDDTVPQHVLTRLQQHGGKIIVVNEVQQSWPGPMWRFMAYDDANVKRVIFRDCDSVISLREAQAVQAWVNSSKQFHMMRDFGSHTELMLAGLWGVCQGALPSMHQLINVFLSKPIENEHFADQAFLRELVWPYARADLLQHDSIFGFLGGIPFPQTERPSHFHVGCNEATPSFDAVVDAADGATVTWRLYDATVQPERLVCAYPASVKKGKIGANIPRAYAKHLSDKTWLVRIETN